MWPAFQIRDDLLDFEAGKGRDAIGNDVRAGKRTLMAIHADDAHVYDILDTSPGETTAEDVETVQAIFEETDSFEYARHRGVDGPGDAAGYAPAPDRVGPRLS